MTDPLGGKLGKMQSIEVICSVTSKNKYLQILSYFVVATDVSGVVGAPFQICVFPQVKLIAEFQPNGATGKLKAVIIPIDPSGFHCSSRL